MSNNWQNQQMSPKVMCDPKLHWMGYSNRKSIMSYLILIVVEETKLCAKLHYSIITCFCTFCVIVYYPKHAWTIFWYLCLMVSPYVVDRCVLHDIIELFWCARKKWLFYHFQTFFMLKEYNIPFNLSFPSKL